MVITINTDEIKAAIIEYLDQKLGYLHEVDSADVALLNDTNGIYAKILIEGI